MLQISRELGGPQVVRKTWHIIDRVLDGKQPASFDKFGRPFLVPEIVEKRGSTVDGTLDLFLKDIEGMTDWIEVSWKIEIIGTNRVQKGKWKE
jgi:hypothetical protein